MLGKLNGASVVLLVGIGHNGGGGLVAGRFLANWGAQVEIVLGGKPAKLRKVTRQQFRVLKSMGVLEVGMQWTRSPALFIDALLGYRGKGNPREPMANTSAKSMYPVFQF
jgi:NAD(P)H-hydrate epimerase